MDELRSALEKAARPRGYSADALRRHVFAYPSRASLKDVGLAHGVTAEAVRLGKEAVRQRLRACDCTTVRASVEGIVRAHGSAAPAEDVARAAAEALGTDGGDAAVWYLVAAAYDAGGGGWAWTDAAADAADRAWGRAEAGTAVETVAWGLVGSAGVNALNAVGWARHRLPQNLSLDQSGRVCDRRQAADRAEGVLEASGGQENAAALARAAGTSAQYLSNVVSAQERFVRRGPGVVGLTGSGEGYRSVCEEIASYLDRHGPSDPFDVVVDLTTRFELNGETVDAFLGSHWAFVREGATVRNRTAADPDPFAELADSPLGGDTGAQRLPDGTISIDFAVTAETVRGSGRGLRLAVGASLGVTTAQRVEYQWEGGTVTVSVAGDQVPHVSSLKAAAESAGCREGDVLRAVFDRAAGTVSFCAAPHGNSAPGTRSSSPACVS